MRDFTTQTPAKVREALSLASTRLDHFLMFDSPAELADAFEARKPTRHYNLRAGSWDGNATSEQAMHMARAGDLSGVAASEALLSRFERFAFETGRKAWTDGVTGAIPNVPAFIAGHPLNMRRRTRQDSAAAPIAVAVDLTTSATFGADDIRKRGAAILALVRILSTRRPVELWAGVMLDADNGKNCVSVFCKIETAPLDLATAAHVLTHASFPRRLCYGLCAATHGYLGNWPYSKGARHRQFMADILSPAFAHASETLCLSSLYAADESVDNPERWIELQLEKLSPADLAA